jgi:hypothetical protein
MPVIRSLSRETMACTLKKDIVYRPITFFVANSSPSFFSTAAEPFDHIISAGVLGNLLKLTPASQYCQ